MWVTSGCSGEFFLCYEKDSEPTRKPETTVTSRPVKPTEPIAVAVVSSSSLEKNNVWIYIIVASCVILLVGFGLIVGCVVKRRQQNDKSRQLAEKRQIRIELKEHRENMEENGVTMVMPLANRSLSLESINYGDAINYSYGNRYEYDKDGSVCSSQSSHSGMTSLSARTTGYLMKTRPSFHGSMRRMQNGILKKGISTPDISVLGKMYCEANMNSKHQRGSLRRQSKNSLVRGSQSSLESVREVCSKYQVFDIPLEKKLQQQYRRPSKYNTVSFGVGSSQRTYDSRIYSPPENASRKYSTVGFAGSASERAYRNSIRSLPGSSRSSCRKITRAIVHSRTPSVKDSPARTVNKNEIVSEESGSHGIKVQQNSKYTRNLEMNPEKLHKTNSTYDIPRDTQYHDPTSLIVRSKSPEPAQRLSVKSERPESPVVTISKPESIYEIVDKLKVNKPVILPKPKLLPKPNTANAIYATVNKSYFKAASRAERKDYVINTTTDVVSLEDDEDDAVSAERESQYARLEAFKPASVFAMPVPSMNVPGVSTGTTNI
ncbi:uncharacterized protein LOC123560393 [Mercenaria mercenaria]|uniref:uncharacterized protein LOC123560393 n=1 Tax=Mercenaria mercenaria TaxID=6596 RepID=UPI00234F946B|nr:uncharacterized protein LOC123560393 [Mercenaria mercenaria]